MVYLKNVLPPILLKIGAFVMGWERKLKEKREKTFWFSSIASVVTKKIEESTLSSILEWRQTQFDAQKA